MAAIGDRGGLPVLSCIDTQPAYVLIHEMRDADFPERAAYVRALLARTAKDLRETAEYIEKRLAEKDDS